MPLSGNAVICRSIMQRIGDPTDDFGRWRRLAAPAIVLE
jgi:hypothetical protein